MQLPPVGRGQARRLGLQDKMASMHKVRLDVGDMWAKIFGLLGPGGGGAAGHFCCFASLNFREI
jgi:hypothetical protein